MLNLKRTRCGSGVRSETRGNIRHLAMQFCLAAPIDGVVMFGPADTAQVEDGYAAATADISEEIWEAFAAEFGITRGM